MSYKEFAWTRSDGNSMFACEWLPHDSVSPKAAIGLVHGMGEHSARYTHVAEALTALGYAVFAFDQYGHGRTEGKRGHADDFESLLEGVDHMLAEAERQYPGLPKFLYGHSMGGGVTLNYVLRRRPRIHGAIASSPWLRLAFQPPPVETVLARLIERIYPKFSSNRPFATDRLTDDPEIAKRITEDRLGHGQITARFFLGMQRAGKWALEHAGELSVPVLLMHGDSDQVTSFQASKEFADRAGSLCTFTAWPNFRHELHNHIARQEVFACVDRWLSERLAQGQPQL